jgi:hypothetical protein
VHSWFIPGVVLAADFFSDSAHHVSHFHRHILLGSVGYFGSERRMDGYIPRQRTPGEWMSFFISSTDPRSSIYPDILKTRTSKIATTTSTIAAIIPITKLSGLYPLFQHTFEIKYANVNDATIYTHVSKISRKVTDNAAVIKYVIRKRALKLKAPNKRTNPKNARKIGSDIVNSVPMTIILSRDVIDATSAVFDVFV